MFRFLVTVVGMMLCFTGSAQATNEAATENRQIQIFLEQAEKEMGETAQFELAQSYYFGLNGVEENPTEAYFWFSACAESLKTTQSFKENLGGLEEMAFLQESAHPGQDQMGFFMKKLLVDPNLLVLCEDFASVIEKELSTNVKKDVRERLELWKKNHFRAPPQMDQQAFKKYMLTSRLVSEVDTKGAADVEGICKLIKAGADIRYAKKGAPVLLTKAAENGREDIVSLLLEEGLDDPSLMRDAMLAARRNNHAAVERVLFESGVDWNWHLSHALHGAMRAGDTGRVEDLIKKGATLGDDKRSLGTLISDLIREENIAMIKRYIALAGPVAGVRGQEGYPMQAAAKHGDAEIIQLLLDAGASASEKEGSGTALYHAVQRRNLSAVKKLVEAGALTEDESKTIVKRAIHSFDQDILDFILKQGLTLSDEQKALLAKCPFEKKQCNNGVTLYGGPLGCHPVKCTHISRPEPMQEPAAHPSNEANKEAMDVLSRGRSEEKSAAIKKIMDNPGLYNPLVLRKMAEALFRKFRDEEGIFWSMAAELRTRAGHEICTVQNGRGSYINDMFIIPTYDVYKRREVGRLQDVLSDVKEWDAKTPHAYNPRYMLYPTTCVEEEKWDAMRASVREYFYPRQMARTTEQKEKIKVDEWLPLAEQGDAEAQFKIAECYMLPMECRMPATDTVRAFAHKAKQTKAQEGQSVKRYTGNNMREEYQEKAIYWYEEAAAQGFVPAVAALVRNYKAGRGVEKDDEKARQLAMNLFEKGEPEAIRLMAVANRDTKTSNNIHWYAWGMVTKEIGLPWIIDVSRYEAEMSSEELAQAREKGEDLIKLYLPLYGSKR